MTNAATLTPAHQTNIVAKAKRALAAITHLAEHTLVPSDQFPQAVDLITALVYLERVLFEGDVTEAERACWWKAIGMQDALLAGGKAEPTTFTTSRPYVAMLLRCRIETLELADPFDGLF